MRDRRGFLAGLAALPLIGGAVSLIGQPTAAAVPVSDALMWSYKSWLFMEHRMISFEMAGYDVKLGREIERLGPLENAGADWHFQLSRPGARGPAGWIDAPQPSTRAALVLAAVRCPLPKVPL